MRAKKYLNRTINGNEKVSSSLDTSRDLPLFDMKTRRSRRDNPILFIMRTPIILSESHPRSGRDNKKKTLRHDTPEIH